MTWTLWLKLMRDLRLTLVAVALLLGLFQVLWAKVTERVLSKLAPFFSSLASLGGLRNEDVENVLFEGPGKIIRTILGGDRVQLDNAMDLLSIGYVHPTVQMILCIWAVGRAAGAIAGEIDRGTMELLLAQPVPRSRLVLAHLLVDLFTIPVLCLSLWAGTWIGVWMITPIQVEEPAFKIAPPSQSVPLFKVGPFTVGLDDGKPSAGPRTPAQEENLQRRLRIEPWRFGASLWTVAGLLFAICGYTMWLSAAGRFRWRVLGLAVFITLLQFLVNLLGQMWDQAAWLRPFTIFYYYQPQLPILAGTQSVTLNEWNGGRPLVGVPMPAVLFAAGLFGYAMALRTLVKRDLPAPL